MRSVVSILLMISLVILTPVLFVVTSIRFNVVSASFFKRGLIRADAYRVMTSLIDTQVQKIALDEQFPVTHEEIAALAHSVITEAWLQQALESGLDQSEAWLRAPRGTPMNVLIDVSVPKQQLVAGVDAFLATKVAQLPPCPDMRRPKQEQGVCQFAGLTVAQVKEQLAQAGLNPDLIGQLLPDRVDLLNPDFSKILGTPDQTDPNAAAEKSEVLRRNLELVKARYQQGVSLLTLALVIDGLLAALFLAINATRGWRRLVRWGGALFFAVGVFPLGLAIASTPVVNQRVLPNIHFDAGIPAAVVALVPVLIEHTRAAIFSPLFVAGAVLVALGLAGLVGGHWVPRPIGRTPRS